jgi:hypothetical protein
VIVSGELDDDGRGRLAVVVARVRALQARMGEGCGRIIMMAAGRSTPEQRAAWRVRNDRRNHRRKNSLGRIVLADVPHDAFIRAMLDLGLYVRPRGRAPTFNGAVKAFEVWIRAAPETVDTRVTIKKLPAAPPGEKVNSKPEAANHEHADAKS